MVWVWAFGFAILKLMAEKSPETTFYAYEKDEKSREFLQKNLASLYFFPGVTLPKNIVFLERVNETFDTVILAIPNQFVSGFLWEYLPYAKENTLFINLSKGIDMRQLQTVSQCLQKNMIHPYRYAVLSGGMIAQEVVDKAQLWATIGLSHSEDFSEIQQYFETDFLHLTPSLDYVNIEVYGALKNIFALYVWYLEGKGEEYSRIGFELCNLLQESRDIVAYFWGSRDFCAHDFALLWDMVATCFGKSRNRYFGNSVGGGLSVAEALEKLHQEKKHAEGYYTLQALQSLIEEKKLPTFWKVLDIFVKN